MIEKFLALLLLMSRVSSFLALDCYTCTNCLDGSTEASTVTCGATENYCIVYRDSSYLIQQGCSSGATPFGLLKGLQICQGDLCNKNRFTLPQLNCYTCSDCAANQVNLNTIKCDISRSESQCYVAKKTNGLYEQGCTSRAPTFLSNGNYASSSVCESDSSVTCNMGPLQCFTCNGCNKDLASITYRTCDYLNEKQCYIGLDKLLNVYQDCMPRSFSNSQLVRIANCTANFCNILNDSPPLRQPFLFSHLISILFALIFLYLI